jgi:hypothetical protein
MRLNWRYSQLWRLAVISTVSASLIGCGKRDGLNLVDVSGRVTLDGQPLSEARVEFQPQIEKGSPSYARTDAQGGFQLKFNADRDGALAATHIVRISTFATPDDDTDGKVFFIPEKVPRKYNADSVIKVEVKPGVNPFQFDLISEPATAGPRVTRR